MKIALVRQQLRGGDVLDSDCVMRRIAMTALPDPSSWIAVSIAFRFANTDWLKFRVSVVGLKSAS